MYQQNKSPESKVKFLKQTSPLLSRNVALWTFGKVLIVFSKKVNLLNLLYSTNWRCCLLHLKKKTKLFTKNFSKNSNLDDSGISSPVFPSRTNLKLNKISITLKTVTKIISNLDSSKMLDPDCNPIAVLKNYKHDLFNMCLKELFSKSLKGLVSGPCV